MSTVKLDIPLCVYCYKPAKCPEFNSLDPNESNNEIHKRFLNLFSRTFTINIRKLQCIECCNDCLGIFQTFCELFHQIKCLELKLNWQVDKLLNVMRWADRVPSRLKCFRTTNNLESKVKFRKDVKRKFKRHLLNGFPRVSLSVLQSSVIPKIENNVLPEELNEEISTDELQIIATENNSSNLCGNERDKTKYFFLGWLTTLSSLVFLYHLEVSQIIQIQNKSDISLPEVNGDNTPDLPPASPVLENSSPLGSDYDDNCDVDYYYSPDELENVYLEQDSSVSNMDLHVIKEEQHDNVPLSPTANSYFKTPLSPVVNAPELMSLLMQTESSTEDANINEGYQATDCQKPVLPRFPEFYISTSSEAKKLPDNDPNDNSILKQLLSDSDKATNKQGTSASLDENKVPSANPSGRRNLRTKYQCSKCKATFSEVNRFESHQQQCLPSNDYESDSYSKNGEIHDNNDFMTAHDGESQSSSEDSPDEKIRDEILSLKYTEKSKCDLSGHPNRKRLKYTQIKTEKKRKVYVTKPHYIRTQTRVCTKCTPNMAFLSILSLKKHEYYKHSNGRITIDKNKISKPAVKSIRMEGLSINSRYICSKSKCGETFLFPQELENHIKLHGNFTCNVCNFTANHAIKLADHELDHSNQNQKLADPDFKIGEIFSCARCDYKTHKQKELLYHYLGAHFMLPVVKTKCPICQYEFPRSGRASLVHFINCHDLNRLDDPNSKVVCTEPDCSAYFLREDQLHVHWNRQHVAGCTTEESNLLMQRKIAERKKQLDIEKRVHKMHGCSQCSKRFLRRGELRSHVIRAHVRNKHGKGTMGNFVISKEGITINDIVLEENAKYFCKVENCQEKFRKEEDFESHSKLHGEFACNFCQVVKPFAVDLALHETMHVTENERTVKDKLRLNVYKCRRCPFRAGIRTRYLEHFLHKHLGLKMDRKECPICKFVFHTDTYKKPLMIKCLKNAVHEHFMNWHDFTDVEGGEEKWAEKCDKCSAYFKTKLQLLYHNDFVHNSDKMKCEDMWSNVCSDCGKDFADIPILRLHRRFTHKVELKFKCEITGCSKKYETVRELMHHDVLSHVSKEIYICSECGRRFFSSSGLLAHKKTHEVKVEPKTVKKTHVCEQCGKSFMNRQKLSQHYRFHEGPESWEFECEICKKKLSSKQKLNEHMRTHTKEKPFVCQVCGVAYAHRHNLRNHVNSKHKEVEDVGSKRVSENFASWRKGKKLK